MRCSCQKLVAAGRLEYGPHVGIMTCMICCCRRANHTNNYDCVRGGAYNRHSSARQDPLKVCHAGAEKATAANAFSMCRYESSNHRWPSSNVYGKMYHGQLVKTATFQEGRSRMAAWQRRAPLTWTRLSSTQRYALGTASILPRQNLLTLLQSCSGAQLHQPLHKHHQLLSFVDFWSRRHALQHS